MEWGTKEESLIWKTCICIVSALREIDTGSHTLIFCHFEPLRLDPKRPPKMMSGEAFEGLRAINGVLLGLSLACKMKK